jgi:uncharacterized protein YodC (DUF2158 family)
MTSDEWKSGTRVTFIPTGLEMAVVGYDSVGSIICDWTRGEHRVRSYFTPTALTLMEGAKTKGAAS